MADDLSSNPFRAPAARLDDTHEIADGEIIPNGRKVPAGAAMDWLGRGWDLFKQAPGTFIGMMLLFTLIVIILSVIPLINFVSGMLMPVFIGGIMLGCKSLEDGQGLAISHLFAGFSKNMGQLVLVGVLYLAGIVLIGIVAALGIGGIIGGSALMGQGGGPSLGAIVGIAVFGIVAAVLIMPLAMAFYYAPPLVIIHDIPAFAAMKMSFTASLKNWLAFLVYFLVVMVLAIIACIPLMLGLLVLFPVLYGSMYASYRDIFVQS